MLEALIDKYKNKFTPIPIHNEKPIKGKKYFLLRASILQNGIKKIKTIAILIEPNKIGGTDALRASFAVGYALPSKNITIKIKNVCLMVNYLTHCKRIIHWFV